jgi:hypothetical protein
MTTDDQLRDELKALLKQQPSQAAWDAICHNLEQWSDEEAEREAIPLAEPVLAGWPDALRPLPHRWLSALTQGMHQPRAALAASLLLHRKISAQAVASLAREASLKNVTSLTLHKTTLTAKLAASLFASPHLTQLKAVALHDNKLGAKGAAALAAEPQLARLTSLSLCDNGIDAAGAAALAASPHLSRLTTLDLSDNPIGDAGAAALAASPYLPEPIRAQWRR